MGSVQISLMENAEPELSAFAAGPSVASGREVPQEHPDTRTRYPKPKRSKGEQRPSSLGRSRTQPGQQPGQGGDRKNCGRWRSSQQPVGLLSWLLQRGLQHGPRRPLFTVFLSRLWIWVSWVQIPSATPCGLRVVQRCPGEPYSGLRGLSLGHLEHSDASSAHHPTWPDVPPPVDSNGPEWEQHECSTVRHIRQLADSLGHLAGKRWP